MAFVSLEYSQCEHNNMRTYYFAADNEDLMYQWIDALNDASQVNLERGYRYAPFIIHSFIQFSHSVIH